MKPSFSEHFGGEYNLYYLEAFWVFKDGEDTFFTTDIIKYLLLYNQCKGPIAFVPGIRCTAWEQSMPLKTEDVPEEVDSDGKVIRCLHLS